MFTSFVSVHYRVTWIALRLVSFLVSISEPGVLLFTWSSYDIIQLPPSSLSEGVMLSQTSVRQQGVLEELYDTYITEKLHLRSEVNIHFKMTVQRRLM